MKYNHYQLDIFDTIANSSDNIMIEAGPGCSKTTVLVKGCDYIRNGRVALTSFSKLIADELAEKVPFGTESFTLNALGNRIVRSAFKNVKFNKFKEWNILRSVVGEEDIPKLRFGVERVIGLLKNNLVIDRDEVMKEICGIIRFHAIDIPDKYDGGRFEEIVHECYLRSLNSKEMSYDDQKLWVIMYDIDVDPYDVMLVDEGQDLSPLDVSLVEKCARRKIVVGDSRQSIFLFKGALSGAMDQMATRFGCQRLPLKICYRCPEKVIEEARKIYPDAIESPVPNLKGEGDVRWVQKDEFREMIEGSDDMVLCRTTAPLIKECLKNIIHKKCYVKGRDIGEGLERLIKNVCSTNTDIVDFDQRLGCYFSEQRDRLSSLGRMESLSELEDKVESIKVFEERASDVEGLVEEIRRVIVDDGEGIAFMTGHKSKGLESKRVFILRRDLIPHRKAKTEEQLEQERNLEYVITTRSQHGLYSVIKERGE